VTAMAAPKSLRVLVSAYACEPGRGSEPGTGWAWACAAAERHEVWLLTRSNVAAQIEAALERAPRPRLHPVYLDLPPWVRRCKRGQLGIHWYYPLWQLAAFRVGRGLHRRVRFDLAHHVTFASDWMPVGVAYLGVPFIWGPVGGATATPWRLWRWLGWRGCLTEAQREVATRLARRLFARPAARRAALVVAQNHDVARAFRDAASLVVEPHVAIQPPAGATTPDRQPRPDDGGRRHAVYVARLLGWKGIRLAVAALAHPAAAGWTLDVYGVGPEAGPARRLAHRLGVADRVRFRGHRDRQEILTTLSWADALLFPSMHDAGGWAVAEALSLGCPVVCLDRGGPAVVVGAREGVKVPVTGDVVGGLANGLSSLGGRIPPVGRWTAARLPSLLDRWYGQVVERRPAAAADGHPALAEP
jgi:glycosyltransferase involved in cell wall biosynthesis